MRNYGGYEYFKTSMKEWKNMINNELHVYMLNNFGISIKYYGYDDSPAVITIARV